MSDFPPPHVTLERVDAAITRWDRILSCRLEDANIEGAQSADTVVARLRILRGLVIKRDRILALRGVGR